MPGAQSGLGGFSRLLPSHTTGHTGPYPAVRWIERGRWFTPTPKAQTAQPAVSASVPSSNAVRASPFPVAPKASFLEFGRLADTRSPHPCVLPAFRPSARRASPTMPSADFCAAVRPPYGDLSLVAETPRRSPEVRPTAFTARPPDLPPRPLMTVDFAITCPLVRPGRPHYIRFLSIGPRLCSTLPSDPASRRRPCASLILRRHQAG
jgi:hypothetical protein